MALTSPPPSYSQALAQLKSIVTDLESGQLDIDVLLERVQEAEELVAYCRTRLQDASGSLDEVLARMKGRDGVR